MAKMSVYRAPHQAMKSTTANRTYDVVIVGGGHAGTEAALASARAGSRALYHPLHRYSGANVMQSSNWRDW